MCWCRTGAVLEIQNYIIMEKLFIYLADLTLPEVTGCIEAIIKVRLGLGRIDQALSVEIGVHMDILLDFVIAFNFVFRRKRFPFRIYQWAAIEIQRVTFIMPANYLYFAQQSPKRCRIFFGYINITTVFTHTFPIGIFQGRHPTPEV